jgi:hypothetical protein
MLRIVIPVLWAAALALAAVLPTESGDAFYFAFGGQAGAVNAYGQRLWAMPGELIASDPMGSCLAVAHPRSTARCSSAPPWRYSA